MTVDPLAALEPWCDDDLLDAAQAFADGDAELPDTETDRTLFLASFGEEMSTISVASAHLKVLRDCWYAVDHPTAAIHRDGLAVINECAYELVKAQNVYRRALTRLRMTYERKQARSALVDAACALEDAGYEPTSIVVADRHGDAVHAWRKLNGAPA